MSKVCIITGKKPMTGNHVSHAQNKIKRKFLPNIHNHKFWLESKNKYIKLKVSSKGIRIIDKKGVESILKNLKIINL